MRKHALKFISLIAFALAVAICVPQRAAADQDDPPGRIARLGYVEGSVSFEPAGTDDWVTAVVNRPLTTGDKLWADHDSRAELHLGSASIRLGASTGFSFLNLDDNTVQLQLTEGTLRIRVRHLDRDEIFEVDTPNLAFTAVRPGTYRINVNEAGDTTVVVVRDGEGQVTGGGQSYSVNADETGIFTGTDQINADIEGVGDQDDLERWSYERDRREDHSASRRYVSDEAIGYEDLDENGGWRDTPDYGAVWFPHTTVVGWAPYRYGHWVWIAPWGYTWVDDEPWGFAPFHYGRWVVVGGSWGWVPCRPAGVVGVAYIRPVYAPALVAWVGGGGFAVGVVAGGGPAVGWFPLGPREVYVPSYRVSRTYVNNVNITNTTVNTTVVNNYYNNVVVNKNVNVTNVKYVNQGVPGAVTATSTQTFTTGQAVHNNVVRVNERQMASAQVTTGPPAVPPTRQSVEGAGRPAASRPPEVLATRAVVAKTAPPPPPAKFERQQAAIQQNGGRPLPIAQVRQIQQEQPKTAVRMAPPARSVTPAPQNASNRPGPPQNLNRPMQQPANQQPSNAQQNNRPGTPPANAERSNNVQSNRPPNADRPNTPPPNAQPNRPPSNDRPPSARPVNPNDRPNTPPTTEQPNRPQNNDRTNTPNTPPPNAQPNRPASNDRPPSARPANPNDRPNTPPVTEQPNRPQNNDRTNTPNTPPPNAQPNRPPNNDRPPSARPSNNPPPNGNPQLERQHQQELENMRKQQDQERQRVEQQQMQERQRADQQRADDQRRQQMQQQHQQQLQDLERQHQQQQQQVQQRQQQEHQQQQRPPQAERQQAPPPRQQQQAPPPRQQQAPPRQQDKPKEKPPKA